MRARRFAVTRPEPCLEDLGRRPAGRRNDDAAWRRTHSCELVGRGVLGADDESPVFRLLTQQRQRHQAIMKRIEASRNAAALGRILSASDGTA